MPGSSVERSRDETQRKAARSVGSAVCAGITAADEENREMTNWATRKRNTSIPFFRWTMGGNRLSWSAGPIIIDSDMFLITFLYVILDLYLNHVISDCIHVHEDYGYDETI